MREPGYWLIDEPEIPEEEPPRGRWRRDLLASAAGGFIACGAGAAASLAVSGWARAAVWAVVALAAAGACGLAWAARETRRIRGRRPGG